MFVQALAQFADTNEAVRNALQDEAWEERPVQYLIELAKDGSFLNLVERMTQVPRGKKMVSIPQMLLAPRSPVNRNSGHHPLLGADDIAYVLGIGAWTKAKDKEKHHEHYEAFIQLIAKAADATNDSALLSCKQFYKQPDQIEKARAALADAKTGSVVALSVDGPVVLRPSIQAYWREHYNQAFSERVESGGTGECLISGVFGPIAPTHEKIKGVSSLGGQASGVSLMSFDKEAFRSYGWEQNQNSPVSPGRAMAYVLALNHLLRSGNGHRTDKAGVAFIFWLKNPEDFDLSSLLDKPDVSQIEALLKPEDVDADPNQFYFAGVTGNGGRLRVLYWVTDSLPRIKHNLGEWFEQLRVSGFEEEPVRFWQLLHALDREGEPPKHRVIALMRRAIEGRRQPLGYEILTKLLGRLRLPEEISQHTPVSAARWGLLRLCINDIIHVQLKGEKFMTESLDPAQTNAAYVCGRLLAEYEGLQYSAFRSAGESPVNVSVADRYYSLASTYPAIAFPKVEVLGKKHLRKLQRLNHGAAVAIDQRLQELHLLLEKAAGYRFPSMLSLEDQGRFALGYHNQRAHSFAQAKARKESKEEEEN